MSKQREKLFTDFPPVTTQEWMEVITKDLKGADFQKKLVWRTQEGFDVNPFYRAEDIEGLTALENLPGQFPYLRGTRKDNVWYVRQEIDVTGLPKPTRRHCPFWKGGSPLWASICRRMLFRPEIWGFSCREYHLIRWN